MKLNHVHLAVDDVPAAGAFLAKHFGLRPEGEGHKNRATLLHDDGLVLTLIGVGSGNTVTYPKTFHLGFLRPSADAVDQIHRGLVHDGFDVAPPREQHAAWAFSVLAPGGFKIVVRG